MAYVDWLLRGRKIGTCSCDYGCPCEFLGRPTNPPCEGLEAMEIEEGYFGSVRLDGLRFAGSFRWPGAVHEGHGEFQPVMDKRASDEQLEALGKILAGEEQEPTTAFNIYGSTIEKEYEPIIADIEFEWDETKRTARAAVAGVFEARFEPIRNPVTGKPHLAFIRLPEGFEFREAEVVSADLVGTKSIEFNHQKRYGALARVAYGPYGIIDD
jgi:hypothetical protein